MLREKTKARGRDGRRVAILNKVDREGLSEEVTFKQRPEGGQG